MSLKSGGNDVTIKSVGDDVSLKSGDDDRKKPTVSKAALSGIHFS